MIHADEVKRVYRAARNQIELVAQDVADKALDTVTGMCYDRAKIGECSYYVDLSALIKDTGVSDKEVIAAAVSLIIKALQSNGYRLTRFVSGGLGIQVHWGNNDDDS